MIINSTIVYALAGELKQNFSGSKILEIRANSDFKEILFLTRTESRRQALLISIHPEDYRIEILDQKKYRKLENQFSNKNILSELIGAKIETIEQIDFDRIIKLSCVKAGEKVSEYDLYLELTGRNSNLILVNHSDSKIIDVLKKAELKEGSQRTLLPDYPYKLPPPPPQKNPFLISASEFRQTILSNLNQNLTELLSKTFLGVDKFLAGEILFLSGLKESVSEKLSDSQLESLWNNFSDIFAKIKEHKFYPMVILDEGQQKLAISVLDLKSVPATNKIKSESVADAVSEYFKIKFTQAEKENLKKLILQIINSQLKKLEGRKINLQAELKENQDYEKFKKFGDLLTISLDKIQRGQPSVKVADVFDPDSPEIEIPLDPERSPAKNADNYYRKFRKAKTALEVIKKRLHQTEAEIKIFGELKNQAESAVKLEDLEKIKEILVRKKLLVKKEAKEKKSAKQKKTLFREFVTSDGWKVLVGRNSKENEYLSFRYARPHDFWFHAHTAAGAHVVLVRENRKQLPPNNTIVETAKIAAYYSKAKGSKKVEVLYTEAKFVKKPRKGKTGTAIVERKKTILVEPKLPEERSTS
ncbi:MAG TPA: NFACT family protein [candidate division Zixibacteria bacterium]|nr:NFACT family protein [candidate division Zixibacteria bacterium]